MTTVVAAEELEPGVPGRADPGDETPTEEPARATTWLGPLLAALTSSVIPVLALLSLLGPPDDVLDWLALVGPLLVGAAVLLSKVRVEMSIVVLGLATALPLRATVEAFSGPGWESMASMTLFVGLCWVTCALGRDLVVRWSALWMVGFVAVTVWSLDGDAPVMILSVGWWLVGLTLRHRQRVADRLRARADELAAEQDRFVAEAVRLERARIARELHDVVAHCMTVIVIQARAGQELAGADPAAVDESLDAVLAAVGEAESDLSALVAVTDAQPRVLDQSLIEALVSRASSGTQAHVEVRGDLTGIGADRAAITRRAIQEGVTNAIRHAPGAPISVDMDCRIGVRLAVENQAATSVPLPSLGAGRGLEGLRERAEARGGQVDWGPCPSGGWRLQVRLP